MGDSMELYIPARRVRCDVVKRTVKRAPESYRAPRGTAPDYFVFEEIKCTELPLRKKKP